MPTMDSMDFTPAECQARQRGIYADNFQDALGTPQIRVESSVKGLDSGCLLVLRYEEALCRHLEQAVSALYEDFPRVRYDSTNLHTTLLTGPKLPARSAASEEDIAFFENMRARFNALLEPIRTEPINPLPDSVPDPEDELDQTLAHEKEAEIEALLEEKNALNKGVEGAQSDSLPPRVDAEAELKKIDFELQDILVNSNSLIAASEASDEFWILAHRLLETMGEDEGWKMPWGAHITLARFLETGAELPRNPDAIGLGLLAAISEPRPVSIELVWFECDEQGFRFV